MDLPILGNWFRNGHMIKVSPTLPQDQSIKAGGSTAPPYKSCPGESLFQEHGTHHFTPRGKNFSSKPSPIESHRANGNELALALLDSDSISRELHFAYS